MPLIKFEFFVRLKNNMGETRRMDLKFDGLTGRLTKLSHSEREYLKQVEAKAKQRKAQAYKESTGGVFNNDDNNLDTVYSKPEGKHVMRHKALINGAGSKKDGDVY